MYDLKQKIIFAWKISQFSPKDPVFQTRYFQSWTVFGILDVQHCGKYFCMTIWVEPHKANKNENIIVFAYRKAPRLILYAFHL